MTDEDASTNRRLLYVHVRRIVMERIETGSWKPGAMLPSEFALADQLGVSQGTVRKGLDTLVADQLLVRRQGRGTFVAEQTPADVLFRFFKIYTNDGERVLPTSRDAVVKQGTATKREANVLQISPESNVIRVTRTRLFKKKPFVLETIVLPAAVFPRLGADGNIPNTLYDVFQHQYGVTVSYANERIEARAAKPREAEKLGIPNATPLLKIDRIACGLDNQPIEWRVSLCHLKGLQYVAELR